MPLLLDIGRVEQKLRLEKHSMPGGVVADDLGAGAVATASLAAGAATLPKSSFTGMKTLAAAGRNGAGAITLTGAVVGDRLICVFGAPTAGGALQTKVVGTDFEATVTVADQIQQVSVSNLSANTYVFLLIPAAA